MNNDRNYDDTNGVEMSCSKKRLSADTNHVILTDNCVLLSEIWDLQNSADASLIVEKWAKTELKVEKSPKI